MNPTRGTATSEGNQDESCGFTETGYLKRALAAEEQPPEGRRDGGEVIHRYLPCSLRWSSRFFGSSRYSKPCRTPPFRPSVWNLPAALEKAPVARIVRWRHRGRIRPGQAS